MKRIPAEILALITERHGYAELEWTRSIPIPGDPDFPTLQLPEDRLAYSTKRGYPISFAARAVANHAPVLVVQIESFDIERHATESPGWAIPTKDRPQSDDERINQVLGFDEGWEDAELECCFVCDARFAVFWRAAVERERFGLTVFGTESLYPVVLGDRELAPLRAVLAAWARTVR